MGDLEKNMESRLVVKPMFTTDFAGAVVREGADVLTLRAEKECILRIFIDTTDVGDSWWVPLFVHEEWHLSAYFPRCRGIRMGNHVLQLQGQM